MGKWTQRNFWMGERRLDVRALFTLPSGFGKLMRFLISQKRSPSGSLYSRAKPTKSLGGFEAFQFMARSVIPSPRCSFRVKGALAFLATIWKSSGMSDSSVGACDVPQDCRTDTGHFKSINRRGCVADLTRSREVTLSALHGALFLRSRRALDSR